MKHATKLAIAGVALVCGIAVATPSVAQTPTVLVMGEDWDEDTIPRNSRVFNGVLDALERQLLQEGYGVVNETMATQGNFVQGRVRRTDAELYDVAKSVVAPPIDVIVTFKIYPRFTQTSYSTKVNADITGKALSASKNQLIGNFQVKLPQDANAPRDCNRDCAIEVMGTYTRVLGQDLGAALAAKLNRYMAQSGTSSAAVVTGTAPAAAISRAYQLDFNNVDAAKRGAIEEYLAAFEGYQYHRIINEGATYGKYWYETTSPDARLKRNLRMMLEHLNLDGRVACASTQCTIDFY